MAVGRADLVAGAAQVVVKIGFNVGLDLRLCAAGAGQVNGAGSGFRALDALGVIVGDFCGQSGHVPDSFQIVKQPCSRGNPHGRAVAVAAVGLGVGIFQPPAEHSAVSGVRVFPSIGLHRADKKAANLDLRRFGRQRKEGIRHRKGHYAVVGKF